MHDESNFAPKVMVCFCEEIRCKHWTGIGCRVGKQEDDCINEYFETCVDMEDK